MKEEMNYISISNSDKKEWIVPKEKIRIGLCIYQPSSLKGKIVKKFFPYVLRIPILSEIFIKVLNAHRVELNIPLQIKSVIEENFGDKDLTFSYFSGTPSVHQKKIIQVVKMNKIVGYVKYSYSKEIEEIFFQEADFLNFLKLHNVRNVPRCLFCDSLENENSIFIQDTIKDCKCKIKHKIDDSHINFLIEFCEKTKCTINYNETDFFNMTQDLRKKCKEISYLKNNSIIILKGINLVDNNLSKTNCFCAFHGDFTPWNTFWINGEIFAFDFEYGKKTYPKYIDIFHFFTQTLLFEKNYDSNKIYKKFNKEFSNLKYKKMFSNLNLSYIEYLLHIIYFYSNRDKENLNKDDKKNMEIWLQLLEKIIDEEEK